MLAALPGGEELYIPRGPLCSSNPSPGSSRTTAVTHVCAPKILMGWTNGEGTWCGPIPLLYTFSFSLISLWQVHGKH